MQFFDIILGGRLCLVLTLYVYIIIQKTLLKLSHLETIGALLRKGKEKYFSKI